jgi:hypothetical protein
MKGAVIMESTGICAACFEPIEGEPFRFRESGRKFHKSCAKKERNYYVRLEKRLARKEAEK